MINRNQIINQVKKCLIEAGSTFSADKKEAYTAAIERETDERSKWILQTILDNAIVAEKNKSPLCDDTGIPHILLEVGNNVLVSGDLIDAINEGIAEGLKALPGRPMGLGGDELQRIDQSGGISDRPEAVLPSPVLMRKSSDEKTKINILMFGGGPAIRAKTYRVFHKHKVETVVEEIVAWASESVAELGCTPCTLAIGIGRSHFEASSLMLEALVDGKYSEQTEIEKTITDRVNSTNIGPLGIGGKTSVLGTFLKIGPQRASGVRVVCLRPCCCFEPRISSVEL